LQPLPTIASGKPPTTLTETPQILRDHGGRYPPLDLRPGEAGTGEQAQAEKDTEVSGGYPELGSSFLGTGPLLQVGTGGANIVRAVGNLNWQKG
jgi:hypothetical protein